MVPQGFEPGVTIFTNNTARVSRTPQYGRLRLSVFSLWGPCFPLSLSVLDLSNVCVSVPFFFCPGLKSKCLFQAAAVLL